MIAMTTRPVTTNSDTSTVFVISTLKTILPTKITMAAVVKVGYADARLTSK